MDPSASVEEAGIWSRRHQYVCLLAACAERHVSACQRLTTSLQIRRI
jgi:hypothetical protein